MKITEIYEALKGPLGRWAAQEGYGGTVQLAGDPFHLFAMLATKPGAFRVCILFRGEQKRGDYEEARTVDSSFWVVLSRGRGFPLLPGDSLMVGSAGGKPLCDLVEECREVVRGIELVVSKTEFSFDYKGWDSYAAPAEILFDAYQLEFSIGRVMPKPNQQFNAES